MSVSNTLNVEVLFDNSFVFSNENDVSTLISKNKQQYPFHSKLMSNKGYAFSETLM